MRASTWRSRLCPSSPYAPIEFQYGPYDEQIRLDVRRTSKHPWFKDHKETIVQILNTFSVINKGFGYPQGVNYLAFPLFYVYYSDNPDTAIEDTFYSLQSLVGIVLPVYPLDSEDTSALEVIQSISNIVCLRCFEVDPQLSILLSDTHLPFITSIVSSMIPTLYANVFTLQDTLLLWDSLFNKKNLRETFDGAVNVLVQSILFHKNMFLHLPAHTCMHVFQLTMRESIGVCANL